MISLREARDLAVTQTPAGPRARIPLSRACNFFLSHAFVASREVPGCDSSAMDGYAVQSDRTRGANRDRPAVFTRAMELFAGAAPAGHALEPGQAARIFTGAPLPAGADCVIRQEAAADDGHAVRAFVEAAVGANVRRRGEEVEAGALLLPAGTRLDPYAVGLLAAQGQAEVEVFAAPKVAVLAVGDELLEPGSRAQPHQVYDSNGPLLAALAERAGGSVVLRRRLVDRDEALAAALEEAVARCEVVFTAGGASVGERDRVKHVLRTLGARFHFDGVALKPGKPLALAELSGRQVVVLPGNPGAAAVGFDVVGRQVLLKRQGVREQRRTLRAKLAEPQRKQPQLTYLMAASLEERGAERWLLALPRGGGQLLGNLARDGWALLPAGAAQLEAGEEVDVELFEGSRFVPAEGA